MARLTRGTRSNRLVTAAMVLAVSMSFIDQTIVAIASPDLQRDLSLTGNQGLWVINAYLVALAATFALGGRLADVWGRRRMVLVGVAGFALASAACGATPVASWSETWMIAARIGQGFFAALLMPAAIAVVYSSAAPARRGRSMAMFFGITGAFTALGPVLGGYLVEWSWRYIFWINVPVALAALALTAVAPIVQEGVAERIDWRGAALVALGMGLSVTGFSQASVWGWTSVATLACLAGGIAVLAVFVAVERATAVPLVRLEIFAVRGFRVDSAVLFLAMAAFVPVSYFLSVYAQVSLGLSAGSTSKLLLQFFLGFLIAAQVGGRIFDAKGAKPTIVLGCLIGIVGFAWWAHQVTTLTTSAQVHPLLLAGAGIGLLLGPASADAVSRAGQSSYGEVTGINQTVRNYGSALAFAILGTLAAHVFTARFTTSLTGLGVPKATAARIAEHSSNGAAGSHPGVSKTLQAAIENAAAHDFAHSMRAVLIAMVIALVLALSVALLHPGDRPAANGTETDTGSDEPTDLADAPARTSWGDASDHVPTLTPQH
jgi:EmrB/QacA subfamily drug resistance transporter